MKICKLSRWVVGAAAALLLSPAMSERAQAFGGLWSSQSQPGAAAQASEQILFVDNPDSTITAVIQLKYAGPADKFAWLIPVPGAPTVAISSSTVFQRLDAATAPHYWVEVAAAANAGTQHDAGTADAGVVASCVSVALEAAPGAIKIVDQGSLGPYEYVTISVDADAGDPAQVATDWLTSNGYALASIDHDVLSPYLTDGLNLLAFKLTQGADSGAIRPVMLTYESELPMIPIRPTAVAAQDDMAIQVWVVGPSQAVPKNYKSLVLNDALIDWQTGRKFLIGTLPAGGVGPFGPDVTKPDNYDAVVTAAANEAGGQAFVTELGGPASQYRDKVWSSVDQDDFETTKTRSYTDGIEALVAASSFYRGWDGWKDAIRGATKLPADVSVEALDADPAQYRGMLTVDTDKFLQLLEQTVVKPVRDTAATLYLAPYLTRLYTTMSPDEMTLDPTFDYNFELAQVSNVHIAKRTIACSAELGQGDAPWNIQLPQGGVVVGDGSTDWPVAAGSMPANLKVVMLSASGPGSVLEDNSAKIVAALSKAGGETVSMIAQPPQNGVMIGGSQSVLPPLVATPAPDHHTRTGACSVTRVATGRPGHALALWLPLAAAWLWRRSQRRRARMAEEAQ